MALNILILLPLLGGFGLLFWSSLLDEDDEILKLLFRLMFIPMLYSSIHLGIIDATITYASNSDLVEQLTNLIYYVGWVALVIGVYYLIVVLGKIKDIILQRKADKQQRKYG